jgi:osmotically-inducible protein OsmY
MDHQDSLQHSLDSVKVRRHQMREPRLELKIGARVEATDGPFGYIRQVILSPLHQRVAGLVVRQGPLPASDRIVPTQLIADATEERVLLQISRQELLQQEELEPEGFLPFTYERLGYRSGEALVSIHGGAGESKDKALAATHQKQDTSIAQKGLLEEQTVPLRSGQEVWAKDGRAGRIDLLLLDSHGHVSHFVIRKGSLLRRHVIVPVDWIGKIDRRGVWLEMERAALDQLPPYRTDRAIASDVSQALWRDEVLRAIDAEAIDAVVRDGIVTLRGYVSTAANKKRADRAARSVPGVLEIDNQLVTDEEVVIAIAQALARDERTREPRIFVSAKHGVVVLNGRTETAETRAAAEEVAAIVPSVRGVVNYIQAPGVVVVPEDQQVWQPRPKQEVYAEDLFLGHVERVIINPRHRRVAALIVHGDFPELDAARPNIPLYRIPKKERRVVLPIRVVKFVSDSSILLGINNLDAARYPDFALENFLLPDQGWQPPYPYTHADVIIEAEEGALNHGDE